MARPLRVEYPGALYYISAKARDQYLFPTDEDRTRFLDLARTVFSRYKAMCHGYCLLHGELALVLETPRPNLTEAMRTLMARHTREVNTRRSLSGSLVRGRYKSVVAQKPQMLLPLVSHTALIPVAAGLADSPEEYPHSSYRATAGFEAPHPLLRTDWVLSSFHLDPRKAGLRYQQYVLGALGAASPLNRVRGQIALGDDEFTAEILAMAKTPATSRKQGNGLLPELSAIIPENASIEERNRAVVRAHLEFGYPQNVIAKHIGIDYTRISRIISAREDHGEQ